MRLPAANVPQALRRAIGGAGSFRSQVGSTFLARIVALALGVGQGVIIARWLGPEGKGVLAVLLLVPTALQLLFGLGLDSSITFHTASRRIKVRCLTQVATALALVGGALALGLAVLMHAYGVLGHLLPGVPMGLLLVTISLVPATMLTSALVSVLRGQQRFHTVNTLKLVTSVALLSGTAVALIIFGSGIGGVIVAWIVAISIGLGAAAATTRKAGISLRPVVETESLRPMLSFGVRAHAGNVLQFLNYRLDLFILNFIAGPAAVGVYIVASRLGELLWEVPNSVGFVIFSRAASRSESDMDRFTSRAFRWTLVLSSVGAAGLALIGAPAIRLVYGSAFSSAYAPLVVLLPGIVLLGAAKVLTNDIAGRGRPGYNAIVSGVALVLTVSLDLLLIPELGVLGAAAASTSAYVLTFLLAVLLWRSLRGQTPREAPVTPSTPTSEQGGDDVHYELPT